MIQEMKDSGIRVFRDDLYPFLGGGNKGRKARFIEKAIKESRSNAVVTTGGIQSNHCRAVAVLAAENQWKCTLVLHGNREEFERSNGNALIMRLSGAQIIFVDSDMIGLAMDQAMDNYKALGLEPYYIWGGGHTLEGGLAYIEAVRELNKYAEKSSWYPDYIFHASGTGSTQAGILAGLDKYQLDAKVIGISVARTKSRAEEVVLQFYEELSDHYKIDRRKNDVVVLDDYLCGGYEKYDQALLQLSRDSIKNFGFALDTTYSGKAFYGMKEYIERNNIKGNVLFWHTGGIFNFLSQKL